jgi:hypothetical protein
MSDYSTRNIIDYAMDQDGVKFREALYANIHDRVAAHVEAAKMAVAQNLMPSLETETETDSEEFADVTDETNSEE